MRSIRIRNHCFDLSSVAQGHRGASERRLDPCAQDEAHAPARRAAGGNRRRVLRIGTVLRVRPAWVRRGAWVNLEPCSSFVD